MFQYVSRPNSSSLSEKISVSDGNGLEQPSKCDLIVPRHISPSITVDNDFKYYFTKLIHNKIDRMTVLKCICLINDLKR